MIKNYKCLLTVNITQWATKNLEISKSMTNLSPVVLWQTPTFRQQVFLQCSLTQSQLIPETTRRTALILINMNINYRHLFDCSQEPSPEASQLWIPSMRAALFFLQVPLFIAQKPLALQNRTWVILYSSMSHLKATKASKVLGWRGYSFSKC